MVRLPVRPVPLALLLMGSLFAVGCQDSPLPPIADASVCGDACGCSSDTQCSSPTPRCDRNSARCVACLPGDASCPKGQRCVATNGAYQCAAGCVLDSDCPKAQSGAAQSCCAGACIDTSTDTDHCGKCDKSCPAPPNAGAACVGGACALGPCTLGFADCDGSTQTGCEVDVRKDPKNCSACGKVCSAGANQVAACVDGACAPACQPGFAHCSGNPSDGCEVNTNSDNGNCGACGNSCGALPHASARCQAGACAIAACVAGFDDCNKDAKDGCEAELGADGSNCGSCGNACPIVPNGMSACNAGSCALGACAMGFADCNALLVDGCEAEVASDAKNCGACARVCAGMASMQACQKGACTIVACDPGTADCDHVANTGCEVKIGADVKNCGGCGVVCPAPANGTPGCANAMCGVGSCNFGFDDCNKDPKDGCEASLLAPTSCGVCGVVCPAPPNATAGCKAGLCGIGMCNALWGDCDGNAQNGCEKGLAVDVNNCGACGKVCSPANATGACLNGQCGVIACNQGFADCNKDPKDGCEALLDNDSRNCGACGVACPNNAPYCVAGVCNASTHNLATLMPDYFTGYNGCGDNSNWWMQSFGQMNYDACEALANRYGAQYVGQYGYFAGGNFANCPYQNSVRWVGESDGGNAWVSSGNWSVVNSQAKNTNSLCVLAYANKNGRGGGSFNTQMVSSNGRTYNVADYGVISEKTCFDNANAAGARPQNPYLFANANKSTAFMVENHQNHGDTLYNGANTYSSDGGCNHTYRCFVGYTP